SMNCMNQNVFYTPDENGQITRIETDQGRRVIQAFDDNGNVIMREDINGLRNYQYDPIWNKISRMTDAEGNITKISYNNNGLVSEVEDELGHKTQMNYDEFGNMVK